MGSVHNVEAIEGRVTTFSALANRNYRFYWIGLLAAFAANQMVAVARGILVYQMTESPLALGLVSTAWGAPIVVFSLIGGALADRLQKRNLLMVTQAASGIIDFTVAFLVLTGIISFWHLLITAMLTGVVFAFNYPGRQAIIPELVDTRLLLNAVALNSAGMNLMRVVAPAMAGSLAAIWSIAGVYFISVGLYIMSIVMLIPIVLSGTPRGGLATSIRTDLQQGVYYIRHNRIVMALLAIALVPVVLAMPYIFLLPVFALHVLNVGEAGLGWLMAMVGLGALVGGLGIASLDNFKRKGWLLLALVMLFALSLVVFALSKSYILSLVALIGVGAGNMCYLAVDNTLLQTIVPPEMRGRVLSIYMMTFGLMPLGTLPISAMAELFEAPLAVGAGAALVAVFVLAMTLMAPSIRHLE